MSAPSSGKKISGNRGERPRRPFVARPVVAEGTLFASYAEADSTLGLNHGRTKGRVQNGWPGYYDAQDGPKPCRKGKRTRSLHERPRPVIVSGNLYESLAEATIALGLPPTTIHRRIKAGCRTTTSWTKVKEFHVVHCLRVRLENHGWAFRRRRLPPMATRIMAWETSIRFS